MTRSLIIDQIKHQCIAQYSQITDWVHDIHHIRRVVKNGRLLSKKEHLSSLNTVLVEIACWLHDIGRVGEETGLEFTKSNHAEISYQKSKSIVAPFQKQLGREGIYKVLQAVREHNKPQLLHSDNIVGRLLVDADRGAGLNPIGIYTMLSYLHVTKLDPVFTIEKARKGLPQLLTQLEREGKLELALEKVSFFNDWYYGTNKQKNTGVEVDPLYTKSAVKLYKRGFAQILRFEEDLRSKIACQNPLP